MSAAVTFHPQTQVGVIKVVADCDALGNEDDMPILEPTTGLPGPIALCWGYLPVDATLEAKGLFDGFLPSASASKQSEANRRGET